jgi:hypothetical protein
MLARRTIASFSRPDQELSREQLKASRHMKIYIGDADLLFKLGLVQADILIHHHVLKELVPYINTIFFFGALNNVTINWVTHELESLEEYTVAWTKRTSSNGRISSAISMHPARKTRPRDDYVMTGRSLAQERLGTVPQECIHAFLDQYACLRCVGIAENHYNHIWHGRAWHLIAKAIEEQSLRLIGTEVDLGRLDSLYAETTNSEEEGRHSAHDLKRYGFLDAGHLEFR